MKKKLSVLILIVLILSLALAGCGKKDPTPQIQAQATALMDAMVAGDSAKVAELVSPDLLVEGGDLDSFGGSVEDFAESLAEGIGYVDVEDLSDEALASIEKFKTFLLENLVESYELGEIKVDGDTATVEGTVNYTFDPDKIEDVDIDSAMNDLVNAYTAEHIDELIQVLNDEGEDALSIKMLNDLIPDIFDAYSEAILELGKTSENTVMTLTNQDGSWIVTGFKALM